MAPHSSTLAWKIPWTEEPGRLPPMGLLRVRHDWATSLSPFTLMHWRKKWQPTPVFLPGESQGPGSLVGCCLWGCTESDTTEAPQQQQQAVIYFLKIYCIAKYEQRRKWQPTPVFLPGESHGQRSLKSCSPWGCKESDITEQLSTQNMNYFEK